MNEKQKEVVDQYDISVDTSYRSRGCLQLVTSQDLFMITPYNGSPLRLACEYELQKKLMDAGFLNLDEIIPNKEGGLLSYDKYRTPFIMKRSFEGRECSLKETEDVRRACESLACLHQALRKMYGYQIEKRQSLPIKSMLEHKVKELSRIRAYIRKSGRRTGFELTFTSCYEYFYEEGKAALEWAKMQPDSLWERGYGICHGGYHQHNVLMAGEKTAVLNIGQFHYNQQILDFYNIIRKALEKNQYQKKILEEGIKAYSHVLPMQEEDYRLLYLLFSFPEKFWKISNQYYNSKKCFLPPKNLEKLKRYIEQNTKREHFLAEFCEKYL
ncbi:MAG: hypothetical protein Q4B70_00160 [Lachnospiraceae bacterium]|nr:hypothetical protein [Lachnospiraceae bacterium]